MVLIHRSLSMTVVADRRYRLKDIGLAQGYRKFYDDSSWKKYYNDPSYRQSYKYPAIIIIYKQFVFVTSN